ncbi:MAG: [FeFe] hydrogenase H-cluster maturation GTPase HydF [Lachnospiraceae bacterium]|nr:[FeFe] hydrogenase H-cluster maturation GTPase HydF [Lachnospiraceae bacterium]
MGLNDTPSSERLNIGFFGMRNAGKSSLINSIAGQQVSLVSDIGGTTTDPVNKTMELLPLGPVILTDTPGFDDSGALGDLRVKRTLEVLKVCDAAVFVTENDTFGNDELKLIGIIKERDIPFFIVRNKADICPDKTGDILKALNSQAPGSMGVFIVSTHEGTGINELKESLASSLEGTAKKIRYVADLISPSDTVVLVIPIDSSAPKGRLILPQQLALRDILDAGGVCVVTGVERLTKTLDSLKVPPALVVTDSQVFSKVMDLVPDEIKLTSFSILMARYKGFLDTAVRGASAIDGLCDGARVLISEGCTHHRQCGDIGTVKLPGWIRKHTGCDIDFSFTQGHGFPDRVEGYDLVIHCGGCMLNDREIRERMELSERSGVPFTNYGIAIAHMNGILKRCLSPLNHTPC